MSKPDENLYEVLGLDPEKASSYDLAAIRAAWRAKSSQHHLDREGGDAEQMSEVNRAYEVLSDPEKREAYDATGQVGGDSLEVQAEAGLMLLFRMALEAPQLPRGADLYEVLQDIINHKVNEAKLLIAQTQGKQNGHKKMLGRIRRKADRPGQDSYKLVLEELVRQADKRIKDLDFEMRKHERMSELLKDDYESNEPAEDKPQGFAQLPNTVWANHYGTNAR